MQQTGNDNKFDEIEDNFEETDNTISEEEEIRNSERRRRRREEMRRIKRQQELIRQRATTWNTRLGIVLRKTMVCILTEHIFIQKQFYGSLQQPSSREAGNWSLFQIQTSPTPTSYTRTATPHRNRMILPVLIRPRSITSSQPRHKATWTKTAVPWKKEAQR